MFEREGIITFYAETPIHMGTGQSVSYVDLPIQRERHTGFPVLWSSGIKGVIRDLATRVWDDKDDKKVNVIFGSEDGSDYASCISITDAKILLYPVRSVKGVFAWITCPFVLLRLKEDLDAAGFKEEINIPEVLEGKIITATSDLHIDNKSVALEEFVFEVDSSRVNEAKNIARFIRNLVPNNRLTQNLEKYLAIVSDNVFKDFVNYAVEIRTRIRIEQSKGVVKEGALFSEELIPSESIFYSLVFVSKPYKENENMKSSDDVVRELKGLLSNKSLLQLGGDETTGKGFVRVGLKFNNSKNKHGVSHGAKNA